MEIKDFFRGVHLFRHLTENQIERLAGLAVEVSFPAGNIIRESDAADGMLVITSGMAKVTKSGTDPGGRASNPAPREQLRGDRSDRWPAPVGQCHRP